MLLKNLIFVFFFIIFFTGNLYSQTTKNIIIQGNKNIDKDVIYSIIGNENLSIDEYDKNKIIKLLYSTGNFSNVEIIENEKDVIIKIIENPKIIKVSFSGNKRFNEKDILNQFNSEEYFRNINIVKLDQFIEQLRALYLSFGYNQINIQYDIEEDKKLDNSVYLNFNIYEGKISKINKIYFIGNNSFDKRELLSEMKSKQKNFLIFFANTNFKKYQINNDKIRIIKYYRNNGFRDIEVNYKTEFLKTNNRFNIYFYINEGKKYNIDQFLLDADSIDINNDQKNDLINIANNYFNKIVEKNNEYNELNISNLKNEIIDYLFENGLFFFNIEIIEKITDTNVQITYKIAESNPKYVNEINIYGNTRTLDKVIRREVSFSEGDPVNNELIKSTNKNLNRLGIFKKVSVKEVNLNEDYVDIDVEIEEKSTGEFNIGLAFGTLQGATFVSGLKERNIAGLGREIDFTIDTSPNNTKYNFGIVEPYVFNQPASLIYSISFEENDYSTSSSYNLSKFNTLAGFNYLLSTDLNHEITLEYSLKDYTITNKSTASSDIKELAGNNADILFNNLITYNKLNSFLRPTKGLYLSYKNIFSPKTNSNNGLMKNILTHKIYYKLNKNIFSIQSMVGNIISLTNSTIPTDEKFDLGGRWMRGFDLYGVGPRNSRTAYIGGKNIYVSKFDLHRPLFRNSDNPIDLNLFTDIGTVFDNKNTPTNSAESLRISYGAGIKFYTPIGPIGFSWAFPLQSESYDIERMFLFSIGNLN